MELVIAFIAGAVWAGVFRLVMGQIILREEGRWQFRLCRFDDRDREVIQRVNAAIETGEYEGRLQAWREWKSKGSVTPPTLDHRP